MKVGPRYKICKRLGNGVFEKCQTQKYTLSESRRATRTRGSRPKALSDFGKQLLEKQKVRFTYGITEEQFTRYVKEANRRPGDHTAHLLEMLETRLDNVVYRLGFAPTRRSARQLVAHGHFTVNGKKTTIPSYHVRLNDEIVLRDKSKTSVFFTAQLDETQGTVPTWLVKDVKKFTGTIKSMPTKDTTETMFSLTTVMEFYSGR